MAYTMQNLYEYHHFPNLSEFVSYCDQDMDKSDRNTVATRTSSGSGFHTTPDYEGASELIRNGYPDGVRKLQEAVNAIHDGLDMTDNTHPEFDVVGPVLITGAYCSGDPECMLTPAQPDYNPVINIVVDVAINCNVSSKQMLARGAAILALAEQLERAGKRLAIYASSVTDMAGAGKKGKKTVLASVICLKQPMLDFNLHALSYALTNSDFFRRHCLRVADRSKDTPKNYGSGRAISLKSIKGVENALVNIDLYFGQLNGSETSDPETAAKEVLQQARDAGVIK